MTVAPSFKAQIMGAPSPSKGVVEVVEDASNKAKKIFDEAKLAELWVAVSYKNPFDLNARKLTVFTAIGGAFDAATDTLTLSLIPREKTYFSFNMMGYTSKIYSEAQDQDHSVPLVFETVFHSIPKEDHAIIRAISSKARFESSYVTNADIKELYENAPVNPYKPQVDNSGLEEFIEKQALTYKLSLFVIRSLTLTFRIA